MAQEALVCAQCGKALLADDAINWQDIRRRTWTPKKGKHDEIQHLPFCNDECAEHRRMGTEG